MSNRKKPKANIFSSLVVGFFVVLVVFLYFANSKAKASWFDDGWRYRVAIPISAHTSAETNVYLSLTGTDGINTTDTTKFQTDCGDIRFVNEAGELLAYRLTTACGLAQTGFQIYFESFPAGAQTIYYYYGNPSAPNGFVSGTFATAATGVTLGTRGGEITAPSSPMVYLRLDEGTGQTVANSMETVNNGTLGPDATVTATDPTWRSEEMCVAGKCLEFDSSGSDYVNIANSIAGVKSVSFWVKPTSTTTSLLVLNGAAGNASLSVSSGTISAGAGFTSPTIYVNGKVSSTIRANEWQFVTVTTATGITASNIMLGRVNTSYLDGFMDEVKLFGSVIGVEQIKSGYTNILSRSGGVKNNAVSFGGGMAGGNLASGLVGYWKMDEAAVNSCTGGANDSCDNSGNGFDGAWGGNATSTTGKFGRGVTFDGTTDYVSIADSSNTLEPADDVTISLWANVTTLSRTNFLVAKDGTGGGGYYIQIDSGNTLQFGWRNSSNNLYTVNYSTTISQTATWMHILAVKSGDTIFLYVNGVRGTNSTTTTGTMKDTANALYLGAEDATTNSFAGKLDDFRLYNRALSASEISQIYSWSAGPIGYWKMDENTGTQAKDSSGNSYTGTLTSSPAWAVGKIGASVNFDGVDDYVDIGDVFHSDALTIGFWVNLRSVDATNGKSIVVKRNGSGISASSNEFVVQVNSTRKIEWATWDSGGSGITNTVSNTALNLNQWYRVDVVNGGSGSTAKIYINGVLDVTSSTLGNAIRDSSSVLQFGTRQASNNSTYFDGYLDEVKIYNYARTPAQIIADAYGGTTEPVGYWKLDEGYETNASDSTGNTNSLTLSTASWTNDGKHGKAWNGTGALWLSRANDADLDFGATEDFTLSGWFKSDSATNPANGTEYILATTTGNTDAGYAVYAKTSGVICFGIDDDTTWGPDIESCTTTDYYDGLWHHFTAVRNVISDTTKIYIDAVEKDSDTDPTTATLDGNNVFYVGDFDGDNNATVGIEEFAGDIDELKVYRSALSLNEIQVEYNGGVSNQIGDLGTNSTGVPNMSSNDSYCPPGQGSTCTPPIGHWRLNETSWTNNCSTATSFDVSGNGLSLTSCPDTTGPSGGEITKLGRGGYFDGTDDYLENTSTTLNISNNVSISAWVKPMGAGAGDTYVVDRTNNNGGYSLGWSSGRFPRLRIGNGTTTTAISGTTALSIGRWYHLVGTANSSGLATLYVDGVSVASNPASSVLATTTGQNFRIGSRAAVNTITGFVDEVKVFNYELSAAQVAWDYNRGGSVAYWKMNECGGASVYDSMGNISAGTIVPGASGNTATGTCGSVTATEMWNDGTTGKQNGSLGFDGADDAVTFTANSALNLSSGGTISAWVYPISTGENSFGRIVDKSSDTVGTGGYIFGMNGNAIYGEMTNAGNTSCSSAVNSVPFSQWSHAAWVFNGSNWLFYVNGNLSSSCVTTRLPSATSLGVTIGNRQSATDRTFDGQLDDVRIFSYPLNATQVKQIMIDGAVKLAPLTGSPN